MTPPRNLAVLVPPSRGNRGSVALLCVVASLVFPFPVPAENDLLVGAEIGRGGSQHAYVGTVLRPAGPSPWRARLWLDHTRFEYDKDQVTIGARADGVDVALGLAGAGGTSWWAAYLGARHEHTDLSPDDRGNDSRGSQVWAKLQAETERDIGATGRWRLNAGAAYVFGAEKYWLRGRFFQPLANRSLRGAELVLHGGPDYATSQLGGLYALPLGAGSSMLFKGGLRHDRNGGSGGYAGVEFSMPY